MGDLCNGHPADVIKPAKFESLPPFPSSQKCQQSRNGHLAMVIGEAFQRRKRHFRYPKRSTSRAGIKETRFSLTDGDTHSLRLVNNDGARRR